METLSNDDEYMSRYNDAQTRHKARGSYAAKGRPAMISTSTDGNWWEGTSPIPVVPHVRPHSPLSDGPASPAALFLSAFSSPAPSVRSPSPMPAISPAMAMFHSPPPVQPSQSVVETGTMVGGYVLGPVIGHGGFSTIRTATSSTGGVVAVKVIPNKASADAPRGRVGSRAATVGRAATITARGRTPAANTDPSDDDGRPIAEEAALWSSLSHEHILPLFSAEESFGAWFLFTLYCPAGTLLDLLKRDGQPIVAAKRRPSLASSFSPSTRTRSTSISQPQPRGGLLPETAATLFRQVVRGLRYLHEVARVVHRDIKLENVLVDENGGARITDFGLAVPIDSPRDTSTSVERNSSVERSVERRSSVERSRRSVSRHRTFSVHALGHGPSPAFSGLMGRANSVSVTTAIAPTKTNFPPGSLPYAAPELLKPSMPSKSRERGRQQAHDAPSPAQDIWALGCLLHALFTGRLPFTDAFEPRLQMKIVRGIWDEGIITSVPNSSALLETLRACLTVPVGHRWTVAEVDAYAWAIGVVDEQAERDALSSSRRPGQTERGRRGLSVVRDGAEARDRSVSAVRGRRGAMGANDSSYSPNPRGRRGVSTRRDASDQDPSVSEKPSMIPRPVSCKGPLGSGDATPTPKPTSDAPLRARSFSNMTSSSAVPPLSPGSDTKKSSPDSSLERNVTRVRVDVERLVPNPSPPSSGPRTPEEYVARSRSRGRFPGLDPTWQVKATREA